MPSMPSQPLKIGILGAGPAGLMTALALEAYLPSRTAQVTVLDRNRSATDYPGVEYGIQARACRALERIGQLEAACRRGLPATEIAFYNARLRKRFRSIAFDPKYTRCVVRQEFLADLAGLLTHSEVRRNHLVEGIDVGEDRVVNVRGTVGDATFSESFDLLVACDGVHSIARQTLFPGEATIHDRGFSCIYMLVEHTGGPSPDGFLTRANSGRSELIMGRFSTMTMFPLGHGRLAMGIGFDDQAKARLWEMHALAPTADWKHLTASTKKSIAATLVADTDIDGTLVKALELVPDWDSYKIYLWPMRDTDPLAQPWSTEGNVILIGDSAHAIMPTIGMGASLAIEDAEALAALVAGVARSADTPAEFRAAVDTGVFIPFTAARHPVWVDLVKRARRAALGNFIDVGRRKRFAIGPQIPNQTMSRFVTSIEWIADELGI